MLAHSLHTSLLYSIPYRSRRNYLVMKQPFTACCVVRCLKRLSVLPAGGRSRRRTRHSDAIGRWVCRRTGRCRCRRYAGRPPFRPCCNRNPRNPTGSASACSRRAACTCCRCGLEPAPCTGTVRLSAPIRSRRTPPLRRPDHSCSLRNSTNQR